MKPCWFEPAAMFGRRRKQQTDFLIFADCLGSIVTSDSDSSTRIGKVVHYLSDLLVLAQGMTYCSGSLGKKYITSSIEPRR